MGGYAGINSGVSRRFASLVVFCSFHYGWKFFAARVSSWGDIILGEGRGERGKKKIEAITNTSMAVAGNCLLCENC